MRMEGVSRKGGSVLVMEDILGQRHILPFSLSAKWQCLTWQCFTWMGPPLNWRTGLTSPRPKLTHKPGDGCYASAATVALRLTPFDPAQDVFANISQANLNTWGSSAGPGLLGHITRATDAAKRCARQNRAFPEPTGGGYTLSYEEMLRTSTMKITPTFRKMCKDLGGVEDPA